MINHVSFQGRFTKDLELSYSQNQKPYVKFTVVWSEKSKNSNEKSCFLNCIAFALNITLDIKYLKKKTQFYSCPANDICKKLPVLWSRCFIWLSALLGVEGIEPS